uniref:Peptidase S1 domain-containing protein n=1 Tax=Anopheles coluzzii TaxID=1518534 RepID=A0A8W7P4U7_ANOCL
LTCSVARCESRVDYQRVAGDASLKVKIHCVSLPAAFFHCVMVNGNRVSLLATLASLCTVSLARSDEVAPPDCGVRGQSNGWPFHVGLYRADRNDSHYFCGATIVSSWHVIGSAHCVQPYPVESLSVRYGVSDLTQLEPPNRCRVEKLIVHPEYQAPDFANDIALVQLLDEIPLGPLARPICLWPEPATNLGPQQEVEEDLAGVRGVSVGWGIGLHNVYTAVLQSAVTTVQRQGRCMEAFVGKLFERNEFFCAITPVCSGSGGSGFYVEQKDRYYLRGMTTFGIAPKGFYQCGVNTLTGLLNVARYSGWIQQQLQLFAEVTTNSTGGVAPIPDASDNRNQQPTKPVI